MESVLSILSTRTQAGYESDLAKARAELATVFDPEIWGILPELVPYTAENVANIWKNELRSSVKAELERHAKSEPDYGRWLGEVHFVRIAIYLKALFDPYRENYGWRVLILGVPAAGAFTAGLASHYQSAQAHNKLARASNLLFDVANAGLAAAGKALPGRMVEAADWDQTGLIVRPATRVCGVDISTVAPPGIWLKDVRTTTVKKTIASLICVERLSPESPQELEALLTELEPAARALVSQ